MFIPNHQFLFLKLAQLAQLSHKNLGKPQLFIVSSTQTEERDTHFKYLVIVFVQYALTYPNLPARS